MSEIISRELLSEVLNIENERISKRVDRFCFPSDNIITVAYYMEDGWQHLNIYELAHKCKEWALTNGYRLCSYPKLTISGHPYMCDVFNGIGSDKKCLIIIGEDTEPEAIFKACQWILDNKDNKNETN